LQVAYFVVGVARDLGAVVFDFVEAVQGVVAVGDGGAIRVAAGDAGEVAGVIVGVAQRALGGGFAAQRASKK
jgi:hypothetical protein